MKAYHTDADYCAAKAQRAALSIELADLTHQQNRVHLVYVRDNVKTTAITRAELATRHSAVRLEMALLTDVMNTIKERCVVDRRKDLLDTLVRILDENGQGHHLQTAVDRLATA